MKANKLHKLRNIYFFNIDFSTREDEEFDKEFSRTTSTPIKIVDPHSFVEERYIKEIERVAGYKITKFRIVSVAYLGRRR